ncbi:switch-associated protein 70 [Gambusia affinis]|uniref:switch-associated protein 70 n=1 Tax=Gambusia affinis TaxID=33528 RepID=UPI001CDB9342|nr:switch-associated protein 70 [Gambusia affinis]
MWLREELLKAIWHAFTALDVDQRGKVSKSQLKVLSYNLCTVMRIPHNPLTFEEHFKDDDKGPLSNEGYMPYLNRYILDKVQEDFDVLEFYRMCWTLCYKKNIHPHRLIISDADAFKVWQYFLHPDAEARPGIWCEEKFTDYRMRHNTKSCLTVWELIELVGVIYFSNDVDRQILSNRDINMRLMLRLGLLSPHREARLRRRELRQKQQLEEQDLTERMKNLQAANEAKQRQLEDMRLKMEEAKAKAELEELRRKKKQSDLQDRYRLDLEREKTVRQEMEEQVAQKSSELDQYLQRVRELEDMYHRLQEALEDERQAKQDEEAMRKLQARLLEEEAAKRAELEQIYLKQQRTLTQTEAEKEELMAEQLAKERELQAASQQLDRLEKERQGALEQYQEVSRKLERAANKTKTWKDKVAKHEGLVRLIQPGHKGAQRITNWGPASFTDIELELRKKSWQEKKNQGAPAE